MSEELYTSKDYETLAMELEETKRELKELMRNYMVLVSYFSEPNTHIGLLVADLVTRELIKQKAATDNEPF